MTIELLHSGPIFLTAFLLVAVSLLVCTVWPSLAWLMTGIASVSYLAIAGLLINQAILRGVVWNVLAAIVFVSIPVAVGSRRILVLSARGATMPVAYASGLLFGMGLGWVVVPIVLVAVRVISVA